jgi:hypothetical protein
MELTGPEKDSGKRTPPFSHNSSKKPVLSAAQQRSPVLPEAFVRVKLA